MVSLSCQPPLFPEQEEKVAVSWFRQSSATATWFGVRPGHLSLTPQPGINRGGLPPYPDLPAQTEGEVINPGPTSPDWNIPGLRKASFWMPHF